MTFYAIAGEDSDYNRIGTLTNAVTTTAGLFRTVARCAFNAYSTAPNVNTSFGQIKLSTTITNAWLTARIYHASLANTANFMLLGFGKTSTRRLGLFSSGTSAKLALCKVDAAGTVTTLATEAGTFSNTTLYKYDIQLISFGASGTVNVYRANSDGTSSSLILTYTGDLTTNSITDLDEIDFQTQNAAGNSNYSEIICSSTDTRGMGMVTMEPTANGNTYAWSGSYLDVDETTLSDADLITSTTDGQLAQFAFNSSRIGTPPYVAGLAISARGQSGGGVTTFTPNVRVASTDYYGTGINPSTGLKQVLHIFETNPNTGLNFTYTELTTSGVNYGFRANT